MFAASWEAPNGLPPPLNAAVVIMAVGTFMMMIAYARWCAADAERWLAARHRPPLAGWPPEAVGECGDATEVADGE